MATIETYRKQARQLQGWHRAGNYSVGGKLRLIERYRHLTDRDDFHIRDPDQNVISFVQFG